MAASFALAAAAAVSTGIGAYWSSRAVGEATEWVSRTHQVGRSLEEVLSLLKDAERAQRGYMLTGDPSFLAPYHQAQNSLGASLTQLEQLVRDPSVQERLPALRQRASERMLLAAEAVERMHAGDRAGAMDIVTSGRGPGAMSAAQAEVALIRAQEDRLLVERLGRAEATRLRSAAVAALTTLLLLSLLTTVYFSARRSNSRISTLLQASESARRELEFVQQALDRAAIVAVTDADGRLLHVNDEFVRVSGLAREELVGRDHRVVLPEFGDAFYAAVREGRTWRGELRSHGREGAELWTDTTVVPLLDSGGVPERYIAIHYEITTRKRAELDLRESESRYRTLTEALPHMVWTADPALTPTYFSQHWLDFTGIPAQGLNFQTWLELIHPDDRGPFFETVQGPLERGEPHEAQFRLRRRDGAWRQVVSRVTPRKDEHGRVLQWVGTVTDVHARWEAEQALRESQALVQAVVDGSTALVFAKDLQGHYFLTNRAWRTALGLPPERASGVTDVEVFGPEVAARLRQADLQVIHSGQPVLVEESAVLQGRAATYLSSKFPLRDAEGRIYAVCGVSTDVTELKLAREQVQQLNAELEQRVEERTRQLSEANEELEAFSYSVSHDLRAPLRGLQGFAQAVQEDYGARLDEQGRDYLQRIMAAARRMEHLIQDLLEYGRLSRQDLQLREVNLQLALQEALSQLGGEIRRVNAQIETVPPLPYVRAHPTVLLQVLVNLVGNALKFVRPGQAPRVRIWSALAGRCVRVHVQDDGIGIQPEHQDRIFRVFERLHGQEAFPGTGVGLAIVRKGCERMGGRCGVQSRPGAGSTFWFELQPAESPWKMA